MSEQPLVGALRVHGRHGVEIRRLASAPAVDCYVELDTAIVDAVVVRLVSHIPDEANLSLAHVGKDAGVVQLCGFF